MNTLRQFDLNLLIIFEALITQCHVSRAAKKVFLSQSAMSHALNRLREQLNDPLLVRSQNGLQATPRALEMLPDVQKALMLLERTLTPPKSFDPATSERTFHIACTDYFEAVTLPGISCHLQKIAPNITLEVEMISENASLAKLENGQVDLVVGMDDSQTISSHLLSQHWASQKMVCLVANNNTQIKKSLSLKQFTQVAHVVFSDLTSDSANAIDEWLKHMQQTRKHIAKTVNYMAAASIVAKTNAVMTLPYSMAKLFSEILPVRIVKPPADLPDIHMTLIHHPSFEMDPALSWLRGILHELSDQQES